MDVFDSWHICNHSDEEGRYSYKVNIIFAHRTWLLSNPRHRGNQRWCTLPAGMPQWRPTLIFILRFYAVQALLRSVAPIIAAEGELGGKAISEGWADVDEQKLEEWSKAGQENLRSEVKQLWDDTYDKEYAGLFRRVSTHRSWPRCDTLLTPALAFGIAEKSQVRRSGHIQTVPRLNGGA